MGVVTKVIESQSRHIERPRSTMWDTWAEANISVRPRLYLPAAGIVTPVIIFAMVINEDRRSVTS